MNTTWIGSPNFTKGRGNKKVKQIVIHWFGSAGSSLSSTDRHFQKANGTSAHFAVENERIHQYVDTEDTAWSVGVFERNQETISIEHSADTARQATEETYQTSAKLIRHLSDIYKIPLDRSGIIGHKEVKPTQCPGSIDIDKLIRLAKEIGEDMGEPNFKDAFLQVGMVYKDMYNENWNDAEKKVYVEKIVKKSEDIDREHKERGDEIKQLQNRIKELESQVGTPQEPSNLQQALSYVGKILDERI